MTPRPQIDIHDLAAPLEKGVTLIEASAGTGKTYTIAAIFLRLIVEHGLRAEEILVTTFTRPATAELRARIRELLRAAVVAFERNETEHPLLAALLERWRGQRAEMTARLHDALRSFDQASIDTIHAFCQRVLTRHAFSAAAGEPELIADECELLHEVACDYWRRRFYRCEECLAAAVRARELCVKSLTDLLLEWTQQPSARWLPEADPAALEAAQQEVSSTLEALRTCWRDARAELEAHFFTANAWAKLPYNQPENVRRELAAIGDCLSADDAPLFALPTLFSYTPEKLSEGTRKGKAAPVHAFFDLCGTLEQAVHRYAVAVEADFLAWAPEQLSRRKERANLLSYGDLLTRLDAELRSERGPELIRSLRAEYRAALIDEFQDTDPLQDGIFSRFFSEAPEHWLFLIGDPKQAIYGFRGADVFTYLTAAARAEAAGRVLTLGTNHRSTTPLVQAVNTFFARGPRPFVLERIRFEPAQAQGREDGATFGGAPLRLWQWEECSRPVKDIGRGLARATAAEIARLLTGGARLGERAVRPSDIAILTATNDQAEEMQGMLYERRIPSALLSASSVFKAPEAREMLTLLVAVSRPGEEARLRAALLTDTLGLDMHEVLALAQNGSRWETWSALFHAWHELWQTSGLIAMFRRLVRDAGVRVRLLARPDGERRLTNLFHLAELLQAASTEEQLTPAGVVQWLGERLASTARLEGWELRLERDDDAVRVVTIHQSKGLEYNIVFCPYAWRGSRDVKGGRLRFHAPDGQATANLGVGGEAGDAARAQTERLAEDVRLLYVALTRARHHCEAAIGRFPRYLVSAANWLLQGEPPTLPAEGDLHAALKDHYHGIGEAKWQENLEAVCAESRGTIELTKAPDPEAPPYRPAEEPVVRGEARVFRGTIERDFFVSSFTSLTRSTAADAPERFAPAWTEDREPTPRSDDIHAFPGGARTGVCLHEIFERLDFADPGPAEKVVTGALRENGFDTARWTPVVLGLVQRVLRTELPGGLRLEQIGRSERLVEREFHLPVRRLEAEALQKLIGGPSAHPLQFRPGGGWLKGFIDLIFRFGERFYLIDWKSNRLGPDAAAYGAENVQAAMESHHYPLQAHLYAVALHRYLRQRLPGYDYEQHFGGMTYLFLRGVDPAVPAQGVWHRRPARRELEALNRWLS